MKFNSAQLSFLSSAGRKSKKSLRRRQGHCYKFVVWAFCGEVNDFQKHLEEFRLQNFSKNMPHCEITCTNL